MKIRPFFIAFGFFLLEYSLARRISFLAVKILSLTYEIDYKHAMRATLLDRSLYFKGLLILIRQDRAIREPEKKFLQRIGSIMGFEKKFCRNAINEIINNKNIDDAPPIFSQPEIARFFLHDGLIISAADKDIHENELVWLKNVAAANGIEQSFLNDYLKNCAAHSADSLERNLKVKEIIWMESALSNN